jgi:protein-disulfide isomerase
MSKQRSSPRIQSKFYLPLLAVVVLAAVTVALLAWLSESEVEALTEAEAQELLEGIPQSGITLGEEGAPVTIRLYEDFQCPACGQFIRESFPDLVEGYVEPGEVRLVSETLTFLGPNSVTTARAALAAGEQDRYWNYAVLLFLNQGAENSGYATDEFLRGLANETRGLDVGRWDEARESPSVESEIEAVRASAQADGVESTPTLIITGPRGTRELVGAVPIGEVEAAIEDVGGS